MCTNPLIQPAGPAEPGARIPVDAGISAESPVLATRRNWLWWSLQLLARVVFTVWFRYRAYGVGRLPREGGGLLLINHQSFLDPLLVGLPLERPVSYLARDSLFRVPVVGWILRNTYVIPIDREGAGSGGLKQAVRRLKRGFLVGIFPEGTRSESREVAEMKPGFIALLRRSQVPVFPVGIAGTGDALPRHAWFVRPSRCCVVFGDPLPRDELARLGRSGDKQGLLRLVRERIVACQREAEMYRQGGRRRRADGRLA